MPWQIPSDDGGQKLEFGDFGQVSSLLEAAMPWQIPSDDGGQKLEFGDFGQVSSLLEAAIPSDDWQDLEFGDFGQVSVTNPGRSGDISLFFLSDSIFILGLAMLVNSLATIAIRFFTEKPKEWIESQSLATISVAIAVLGVSINPKSCSYRETIINFFFSFFR